MWWLVIIIPLLLILFLLFLKVRLSLVYESDFSVKIKVLFFNIQLFPKKKKKPNPKKYSLKALEKRQKKLNRKALKKQKKAAPPEENTAEEKKTTDKAAKLKEILELIKIILDSVMSPFGRYLKIEILTMHVRVGTNDPAKTAVIYGGVCQLVAYITELLSNITNLDVKKSNSILVEPDFFEGKTDANINITLGIRIWHVLSLAIKFFMGYLKKRNENATKKVIEDIKQ